MPRRIKIAPSLLAADLARAAEQVNTAHKGGADVLHVDVMDGHFAPNLTFGPAVVRSLHDACKIPIAVHLMVTDPGRFLKPFAEAGAGVIFFHAEIEGDPVQLARKARRLGMLPGVALEMQTPPERIAALVGHVDEILVMTVRCGYTGQSFHPRPARKIPRLREMFGEDIDIAVDGGIELGNVGLVAAAGANVIVAGKGVFWADDPVAAIRELRSAAESALAGE